MKRLLTLVVLTILLMGCGGGGNDVGGGATPGPEAGGEDTGPQTDPETGYLINPELSLAQSGEPFIARGRVTSMNLTPRTAPEYLILGDGGNIRYRILGQSVDETSFEDGTSVPLQAFQIGIRMQATVTFDRNAQPVGRYVSTDVTVLQSEE